MLTPFGLVKHNSSFCWQTLRNCLQNSTLLHSRLRRSATRFSKCLQFWTVDRISFETCYHNTLSDCLCTNKWRLISFIFWILQYGLVTVLRTDFACNTVYSLNTSVIAKVSWQWWANLKSRLKCQSRLGFAHHCILIIKIVTSRNGFYTKWFVHSIPYSRDFILIFH